MSKRAVSVFTFVLALLFVVNSIPLVASASTKIEHPNPSREIAVVLDNSGSMYYDYGLNKPIDRWSNAKYSLEVLASMMSENDSLTIFTMDSPGVKIRTDGSQSASSRVASIHNMDFGLSKRGTQVSTVREAANYLDGVSADEKYLVVTTDGEFNMDEDEALDDGIVRVQAIVNDASQKGTQTRFLAIGDNVSTVEENKGAGIEVLHADSSNILESMTTIANRIFGRTTLPSSFITKDNTLKLDVPMSELIVFAQGKSVSVNEMTSANDGAKQPSEKAEVSFSDVPAAVREEYNYTGYVVNESLHGQLATFDGPIALGNYTLSVDGAQALDVFYLPDVDIRISLLNQQGEKIDLDETDGDTVLEAGTYTMSYSFTDPSTGEELTSSLLYPCAFQANIQNDGNTISVSENESFELARGNAAIDARAEVPGGGRVAQRFEGVTIIPPATPLKLNVDEKPSVEGEELNVYNVDKATPYKIHVVKEDGRALDEDEWALTTMEASTTPQQAFLRTKQLDVNVEKSDEIGVFDVTLSTNGANPVEVSSGLVSVSFKVVTDFGLSRYRGETEDVLDIKGPTIFSLLFYFWWLVLIIVLIILVILWFLRCGRLNASLYDPVPVHGPDIKPGSAIMMGLPKWEHRGLIFILRPRRVSEGVNPYKIPVDAHAKGRRIRLLGNFWKFGNEATFANWNEWRDRGWTLYDIQGNELRSGNHIRRGTRLTKDGYSIRFGE